MNTHLKRFLALALSAVLMPAAIPAAAEELFPAETTAEQQNTVNDSYGETEDGVWSYNDYGDGTVSVTCHDSVSTEVTLPSKINGKTITMVEVDCFKECTQLQKVTLPNTITVIEDFSFYGCTELKEVNIPKSVVNIGWEAFYNCSSLETVTIPAACEKIEEFVFEGCQSLKEIKVSDANKFYQDVDGVLFDIDGTTLIRYPSAKTDTEYTVPDGCTRLEDWSFIGNTYIAHINMNGVTEMGEEVFYYCTALEECIVPETVTELKRYTFANCHSLKNVVLPQNLEILGTGCFYSCPAMEDIQIPETVTTMEGYAFFNCPSLKKITVSKNLTEIGERAMGYYYGENDEYKRLPNFTIDATDDTKAFAYAAENNIRCTGGVTQGTVFIYIIMGVIILALIGTIILVIAQRRIQKRHELQ